MAIVHDLSATGYLEGLDARDCLRAILDAARDGMMLIDAKGDVAAINKGTTRLTGYAEEEVVGRSFEAIRMLPFRTVVDIQSRFKGIMSGLEVPPFEAEIHAKSGELLTLEIQLSPWTNAGKAVGAIALMRNFGGQRIGKPAPHPSGERFRDLVETTSDLVWEMDDRLVYTYISPHVCEMLGYTPEEVLGKTPFDFVPLREARQLIRSLTAAVAAHEPFRVIQTANLHKSGRVVLLETSGVPFFDRSGQLVGYRGIHRDVTQRRAADEQVQATIKRLESTVESVIQAISLTVEMRDHYTAGHQKRVNQLACAIAREMNLPMERVEIIRVAGLLHDFGKIFVPTEILIKPGKLNELEFSLVRSHPQSGYSVLKNIQFPWPIADIVVQHHERMDGSGYPSHLRGDEIGSDARILAVADVVEAMAFHRSYRPALGLDTALREISKNKATLYDPKVAEACLDTFLDRKFKWEDA
ncbi:MAG: PAS domain S-box protein [Dehalococcoidia bacterium]|nr:PAS domain S-box protein [Dehalococcoidia bacterium]